MLALRRTGRYLWPFAIGRRKRSRAAIVQSRSKVELCCPTPISLPARYTRHVMPIGVPVGSFAQYRRVNDTAPGHPAEETIVFRGGISDSLLFHLPATRLCSISPSKRTVTVEVDVGDFVPRAGEGGTVELHIVRQ